MIEVFTNVGQEKLASVLNAALSNEANKIHVEAIAVNSENSEIVTIKREFNSFFGNNHIEKLEDLENQIEKLKLSEVKIIIRSANQKVSIFNI